VPLDLWRIAAAALPLAFLLAALLAWRWPGTTAGPAALAGTLVLATGVFRLPAPAAAIALWRAAVVSLDVLAIVWTALALYQVVELTGAVRGIGEAIVRLTEDHVLQLLIIGFAFTSFLQGVQGFGVPVAVTAPLLLGVGFRPLDAAAVPLVGHAWAVTMGTLATGFQALRAVTGLPARPLALWTGVLTGITAVVTGFAVMHIHARWRPLRRIFGATVTMGLTTAGVQLLLIWAGSWTIASAVASMAALAVGLQLARLTRRHGGRLYGLLPVWPPPEGRREPPRPPLAGPSAMPFHLAFLPYDVLLVIALAATLSHPVRAALETVRLAVSFPAVVTGLGWTTGAARAVIPVLGHPGALILYATAVSAGLFARLGRRVSWRALLRNAAAQGVPTTITILSLVGVAMLMVYSGMTALLAAGTARLAGRAFPLCAPFIGVLGTVVTGSNTNSNVLFGALQEDAARLLGLDPVLIAALQAVGGGLGSMVTPAKVVLATATTGLAGQEGAVMRVTGRYLLGMTALVGLLGLGWSLRGAAAPW